MKQTPPTGASIAYLLKRYPRLSETFILHEILELERQGMALQVFSLLNPEEQLVHAEVASVRAPVRYLPAGVRAIRPILGAHLALLRRAPGRYLAVAVTMARGLRQGSDVKDFVRAGWLAGELERAGITHLHAHFAHNPAAVAHFVHLLTGMPYSVTAHAKDIYTSPPRLLGTRLRAARFVVTCTAYNAQHLASLVGLGAAARIHRIYHGIDLRLFTAGRDAPSPDRPTILAVGRLVEKKGFPYLIEAARLLVEQGYDFRVQIVGGGALRDSLQRQIAEAALEGSIELLEPRPQSELIALYRAATIVTLPSIVTDDGDRDGIPNVLVEAMRLGRPVVSTAVSGIPELVIDGETGLLVPPRDAAALACALGRLLDDGTLRQRLATGAMRHVLGHFDLASNIAQLKALLAPAGQEVLA
jgi:glycosyltransferase involved in cell wall biosynthesis